MFTFRPKLHLSKMLKESSFLNIYVYVWRISQELLGNVTRMPLHGIQLKATEMDQRPRHPPESTLKSVENVYPKW